MGVSIATKHYRSYAMGYGAFNVLRADIAQYVPPSPLVGTISFLFQSDCNGKLTYRQCRDLLNDIRDMPDNNKYYGYLGRGEEACLTIPIFKDMLKAAISHRCQLEWS